MATRKRREPSPPTGPTTAKARKPLPDTMTLEQFSNLLTRPGFGAGGRPPSLQETLDTYRGDIQNGDLLAMFNALNCCWRTRQGFSFEDVRRNPKLSPIRVCEVPAWLLGQLTMLLWEGMGGQWPSSLGAGAPARRALSAQIDLWRTWHVLKLREAGVPWQDVYRRVSEKANGKGGSAHAINRAYRRVMKNLRSDPAYYLRLAPISPRILDAAVAPPTRG